MHLIEELWIVTENGITIYNQCIEEKIDKQIFGGFLAAINRFVKQLRGEECKRIVMGDSQLSILGSEEFMLYFVGRSKLKVKDKKIKKYLTDIKERFCKHFEKEIKNFNGNLSLFQEVEKVINIGEDKANFFGIEIDQEISKSVLDKL